MMKTGLRSQNSQNSTDDSVFGLGYTGDGDAPYTQDPLSNSAQSISAPAFTGATLTQTLYLTETGTTTPISVSDINQGQLGDCFLLSPIGEEALFHPSAITNMIHDNGNGTETVTLYIDKNGRLPSFSTTAFKATTVTINNSFSTQSVNNAANQDVLGNLKEIWPQVIEKAVATLEGGYSAIANGGYPILAMEEITGQLASAISPASLTLAALLKDVSAGDLITMDTSASRTQAYGLVGDHCYMFGSVIGTGASAAVQLINPWGIDEPAAIPLTKLAQSGIIEVDIGHVG